MIYVNSKPGVARPHIAALAARRRGETRYVLVRRWELVRVVFDGEHWKAEGIAASTTTVESLAAASALLSGICELGLPTAWQPEGHVFFEYSDEGALIV